MRSVRATVNRRLTILLACLLFRAAFGAEPDCTNPDTAHFYPGRPRWQLVNVKVVSPAKMAQVRVTLWRSKEVAGCSGAGNSMYAIRLIAESGGKVLYRYEPSPYPSNLWLGRPFELRDVMGLGIPQVLFQTGDEGASDWEADQHVVPISGPARFIDVGIAEMKSSWRNTLGWFVSKGRYFAVKADPLIGGDADIDESCHGCPHHYRYVAYAWDPKSSTWEVATSFQASGMFDGGVDPLVADREYVQRRLP